MPTTHDYRSPDRRQRGDHPRTGLITSRQQSGTSLRRGHKTSKRLSLPPTRDSISAEAWRGGLVFARWIPRHRRAWTRQRREGGAECCYLEAVAALRADYTTAVTNGFLFHFVVSICRLRISSG